MKKTGRLIRNAIECIHCGLILQSTHRHDYRTHYCEKAPPVPERKWVDTPDGPYGQALVETGTMRPPMIMVDGGLAYLRRGYDRKEDYIERAEYE